MDCSIPGPSSHVSRSSQKQKPVKRSRGPTKSTDSSDTPAKRRKRGNERYISENLDGDDAYNSHLSAETRDTVLKLKRIKDPFDDELQQVVDEVFIHIDQQDEKDVNLAESALLLSSVTQVYSTQVKRLHEQVLAFADRLSGKEPSKGRRKKSGEKDDSEKSEIEKAKSTEGESSQEGVVNDCDEAGKSSEEQGKDASQAESSTEGTNLDGQNNGAIDAATSVNPENPEGSGDNPVNGALAEQPQAGESSTDSGKLESILNEIPGPCTRRQSERLKKILRLENENLDKDRDYSLKKKKYDDDPPQLISCHEEWEMILASTNNLQDLDVDDLLPPVLEVQVGRRKKRVTINNNEINDNDGDCEVCQNAPVDSSQQEPSELAKLDASIKLLVSASGNKYETLDHLSGDVQDKFHALIEEMNKLPFEYGLMQQDMFKAYQQKFLQAVTLLSQNSVLVKKVQEVEASTTKEVCADEPLPNSQMSETDKTISSIEELLNQVRKQAAEDYNKGKQSKSDAEVPFSQMIATLKRIICSRYKKWHVRTDSDKAVFRRIKEFEDKVKSVLIRESEQGLFDVKKYEMEVMDVTIKESQENDSDELLCPLSPIVPEGAESPRAEEQRNWTLASSSRRTSIAGSVDGSSGWIRLYDIFSHMKKIDHSETCRHFYAVLALLSHKNLSVNYDTLFSMESAKLITKLLKKQNANDNSEKYPVGAKIMTSRCPDIDRDEVFLAPVFNSETIQQVLEQDGYLSSSGYQSDSQGSSSTSTNGLSYMQSKTIQEAINEFVVDPGPGESFSFENLLSKRRRKN